MDTLAQRREPLLHGGEAGGEGHPQPVAIGADALVFGRKGLDKTVRQGRGRLDRLVGHPVGDMEIPVVADGRVDRHGAVGDGEAKAVVVEAGEVQGRAAAAQDQYGVERRRGAFHALQRVHNARRGVLPLHRGLEELHREHEAVGVLRQVAAEVAVARRVPCGNHRQAVRQQRRLQLLLLVQQPVRLQLLQRAAALQFGGPEGEARLDLVDRQGEAVQFAVAHLHAQQHLHPGRQVAARRFAETCAQRLRPAPPDDRLGLRHDAAVLALAQVQVAVPVGLGLHGRDLRPHPDPLREGNFYLPPQLGLQFKQIYVLALHFLQK